MNREESRTAIRLEDLPLKPMALEQEKAVRGQGAGVEGQACQWASPGCRQRAPVRAEPRWRRFYKVGGSLAALMLLPVTAHAHAPVSFGTPNVVHACKGFAGVLRQITSGSCLVSEAVVHWNITGAAGATGPQGPAGANSTVPGPQGPAGPAGGSPDTPDQVRGKFFQGTACLGNDPSDVMVKVGPLCVDIYEASLWDSATGGSQVATSPCSDNGNDCTSIFARSVAAVTPAASFTWFQAQQACANAGKRLLTNAEWQMAAAGTPFVGTPVCNADNDVVANTGSFSGCVSNHGVNDMVGNVWEWVADWVPGAATCGVSLFGDNFICLAGAGTTSGPGALIRGGNSILSGAVAGVFARNGNLQPSNDIFFIGFRCAR